MLNFNPGEIIYGYVSSIKPPKYKYLIVLHRDEELSIVACFTTSQPRAGISTDESTHGPIRKNGDCLSYVFQAGRAIGCNPATRERFSFPLKTTVTFDYGVIEGPIERFRSMFNDARTVCILDKEEFMNLLYAMYQSSHSSLRHKQILESWRTTSK